MVDLSNLFSAVGSRHLVPGDMLACEEQQQQQHSPPALVMDLALLQHAGWAAGIGLNIRKGSLALAAC